VTAASFESYLPRLVVEWAGEGGTPGPREFEGTMVSIDVSGFTRLSERLQAKGRAGAEELVLLVSGVFQDLMAAVTAPPSDRRRGVALEDVQSRKVGTENQPDRLSDGREDLAGGRLLRDQYRHSAQRRLLLSEPLDLGVRLRIGDRGGHQLGELGETGLRIVRKRLLPSHPGSDDPPQSPFDEDRYADDAANAVCADGFRDRAAQRAVIVLPRRPPLPRDAPGNRVAV
jgi:hypothetical protein